MPAITAAASEATQTSQQITGVTSIVVDLQNRLNVAATLLTTAITNIGVNVTDGSMNSLVTDLTAAATAATSAASALVAAATNVGNLRTLLMTAANTLNLAHTDLETIGNTQETLLANLD